RPGCAKTESIEALMGYDRENLYLCVRTPYSGRLNYRTWRLFDMPLWGEESYEIFIYPPLTGTPEICQLVGNPAGDQADLKTLDIRWNGRWDWKTTVKDNEWLAELRAPFSGLGTPFPAAGDVWSFNLVNTEADAGWCWTQRYNDTGSFGRIKFGEDALTIRPGKIRREGDSITVDLSASGSSRLRELVGRLQLYGASDVLPRTEDTVRLHLKPNQKLEASLSVNASGLTSARVVLLVTEGNNCLYAHTIVFPPAPVTVRETKVTRKAEEARAASTPATGKEAEAYNRKWSAEELGETLLKASQWKESRIGLSDKVPPPWSPLKAEGQRLQCWGRTYQYENSLLPARILSQNKVLVEAAPCLVLKQEKREYRVSQAEVKIDQANESLVTVKANAQAGPFAVEMNTDYEFDGICRSELTISCPGKPAVLTGLRLVFPLVSEYCRFYHWNASISGHTPASDSGLVPEKGFSLDFFREIVWLGDNLTGFSWFAESLENWPLKDEKAIQSLSAASGKTRFFTVKLGDKPLKVERPLRLVFGFGATPVKPRAPDFRRRSWNESLDWCWFWGDGQYYPFHAQPEKARQHVARARLKGKEVMPCSSITFHGLYRFYEGYFGLIENPGLKHREMVLFEPLWRRTTLQAPLELPSGKHTADGNWFGKKFQPQGLTTLCAASDFQDYYLWELAKLVRETGLGAIYLDQPLYQCSNGHHGCGYINYRGQWASRMPIWAMRNMLKRIYNIFVQAHGQSFIRWHSSNQIPVPLIGFVDTFWDGENYGSGPQKVFEFYSELLSEGKMQAQHTGLQFGFYPDLLPELEDRYAPTPASVYDMMGLFLVHDSTVWPAHCRYPELVKYIQEKRFSFPLEKMRVAYYWERGGPVSVSPAPVKFIFHSVWQKNLLV
ncbi:MAG TPA: DUF6067 family protein, partial [bacterium]|nr:DUF6067 family protein [bacterium]